MVWFHVCFKKRLDLSWSFRKKANFDLGETGEFNQRRIYDDQSTFDLLRVISEVLGKFELPQVLILQCGLSLITVSLFTFVDFT